jgi:hypothetical protein
LDAGGLMFVVQASPLSRKCVFTSTISKGNLTLWMTDGGNKGRTEAAAGRVAWLIVEELTLFRINSTIRMLSFAASYLR